MQLRVKKNEKSKKDNDKNSGSLEKQEPQLQLVQSSVIQGVSGQKRRRGQQLSSRLSSQDVHSDMTFQYLPPGKRPRQTVYFENIVNNFIFIDEDGTASVEAVQDAAAATSQQKLKGTESESGAKVADGEADDRQGTASKVKNNHENATTNEQFQLTMGSTELEYDRNEFSTP